MRIDNYLIKISAGYVQVPSKLELGSDVLALVDGEITKVEQKDNQDGTFDEVYTVKGRIAEVKTKEDELAYE